MPMCPTCRVEIDSNLCLPYWAQRILKANMTTETLNEKGEMLMILADEITKTVGKRN